MIMMMMMMIIIIIIIIIIINFKLILLQLSTRMAFRLIDVL